MSALSEFRSATAAENRVAHTADKVASCCDYCILPEAEVNCCTSEGRSSYDSYDPGGVDLPSCPISSSSRIGRPILHPPFFLFLLEWIVGISSSDETEGSIKVDELDCCVRGISSSSFVSLSVLMVVKNQWRSDSMK